MNALGWILVALPLTLGALLAGCGRRLDRVAPAVGVVGALATLGVAVGAAAARPSVSAPLLQGMDLALGVDGLSAVLIVTVGVVTVAVLVFSTAEFDRSQARARFFGLMLMFAGAMLVTVTATTLPTLVMGWEVMGALSWTLIGFWWPDPERVSAANTSLLTTRAADLGLYLAAGATMAGGVPSLRLDRLDTLASPWRSLATAGIVLAAIGKSAQLPFSFWLSRAMAGPSPVSALLHSATMVAAGAYLLLRVHPLLDASGWGEPVVAWIGAATALLLGLVAVAQTDLKQLLAASTCAQIGFMVLAAGTGGIAGGTAQLVAHAATKSLLFLAAGAWLTALGTQRLPELRGAARRYRVVGFTCTAGTLSLAGLAPLSIWAAKDDLSASVLNRSIALYSVGTTAAVVSAVYSVKVAWYAWRPAAHADDARDTAAGRVGPAVSGALILLAIAAVALGAFALPPAERTLRRILGVEGEILPGAWQLVVSAAVALVAASVTWWWGGRSIAVPAWLRRVATEWLFLQRAAHLLIVDPTLRSARFLAVVDDRVVDQAVRGVARAGLAAARTARRVDDVRVDGVVTGIAAGARRCGHLARRLQTGLVHQYYAQAATGIAALILLVVVVR